MTNIKVLDNFFGMNINDQLRILYCFDKVLAENDKPKLYNILNDEFSDYISVVSNLLKNKDLYKELSSSKKRYVKYNVLAEFNDLLDQHRNSDENYYENIKNILIKKSKDKELDIESETKKYFSPELISYDEFAAFYDEFNALSSENQIKVIRKFIKTYKYCNLFNSKESLSYPGELFSCYDGVIFDIFKKVSFIYQTLYPNERLNVLNIINQKCIEAKDLSDKETNLEKTPDGGINAIYDHISFVLDTIYKAVTDKNAKETKEEEPVSTK